MNTLNITPARLPRRIVAVHVISGKPVDFQHITGAYETAHFIILPNGLRLSNDVPTEHWYGRPGLLDRNTRTDYYSLAEWHRSTARGAIADLDKQATP